MEQIWIQLPKVIPILRERPHQQNKVDFEEFSIYFKNIIHPWHEEYDVIVRCEYGSNYGNFWRIKEYPADVDSFPLTIQIYNPWGEVVAEKSSTVELYTKLVRPEEYRLLCLGDSMTHRHAYVDHLATKLYNLKLVGTRSYCGTAAMEGRGGWTLGRYLTQYADEKGGPSPFVFPKNVNGADYFGDISFAERLKTPELETYALDGYAPRELKEGEIYFREGALYRHQATGDVLVDASPEWEFSFEKYIQRNRIGPVDAVSILMGANDYQLAEYEEAHDRIAKYIDNLQQVIDSIHAYDPEIDVILNMPVTCAEQYAWGVRGYGSEKRYRYCMTLAVRAILDRWDGKEDEHIVISPMLLNLDPVYGFDMQAYPVSMYSDKLEMHHSNWVHPNVCGYRQMGDALGGVIEKLRRK